jgi:putative transposase
MKVRVYPSKELHKIWKSWLAAYRWYYNETIALLRCFDGVENISAYTIDKMLQALENKPDWVKCLPGHQRQEACNDACDAFKAAKFEGGMAKFKSCQNKNQIIKFKAGNYKNGTWYPKTTKGLSFYPSQQIPYQCEYGTQLVYQRGKWFACFPQFVEVSQTGSDKVIALDPGNRTFLTGYDGENVLEIGKGDIGRIQRMCLHLDDLISRSTQTNARQRRKMRIAANKMRQRIENLVKDLHNKAVHLLVNSYKLIFLPSFESSQMVVKINGKGKKRKINRKSVRQMLSLSHYKFKQHLKQAANRKGVLVAEVNESYTSKTCPHCGHIHQKLGGNKKFQCSQCGYSAPRDWNGALNIMIRALQATAFSFNGDAITIRSEQNCSSCLV